jgi:hypothetical protein
MLHKEDLDHKARPLREDSGESLRCLFMARLNFYLSS